MVSNILESKYTPPGIWKRVRRLIREPGDILLSWQLMFFIWRVPTWLDRMSLPQLLQMLEAAPRPASSGVNASIERINRLSRLWFRLPMFRNRSTCYLRSLMFYRFLDSCAEPMQIHFVVEPGRSRGERLRGHAWVTVGQELIEPPPPEIVALSKRIYTYPPA